MKALVLSGGGAKGSYQIGVWKALNELNMHFDIVTGSSIGSINAALYAQKKYRKAKYLWEHVKTTDLFDIDIKKDATYRDYHKLITDILKSGGMPFDKAEKCLRKFIDEDKVRKSKIDYGLVTYSLTTKKPRMLSIKEIPHGKLVDYVAASSTCYPAISKKVIDGEEFIDGGYYDNLPINLAIDMGATEVVAVKLNGIGIEQKVNNKEVKIDTIECKDETSFTLNFNKEYADHMMTKGYNDTMKYFSKYDGNIFTFKKGEIDKNYIKIKDYYIDILKEILLSFEKSKIITEIFNITKYKQIFTKIDNKGDISDIILDSLEYLGETFSLDKDKVYKINNYNKQILKEVKELSYLKLDKSLKGKMLIGYIYNKYMDTKDKQSIYREMFNIALIFQKEFLATVYLIAISKKYDFELKDDDYYKEVFTYLRNK